MAAERIDPLDADLADEATSAALAGLSIPPCPAVIVSLLEESRRDDVDFNRISRLVGGDAGVAAAVLKSANSPFFALRRKVQSVQQAVSVLGLRNLLKIVYGVALRQSLAGPVSLERFWERSGYKAMVASYLATRHWPQVADDAYAFGLFHDVGIGVLAQRFPDYKQTLAEANRQGGRFTAVEHARHHTSHVMAGALLARNWYLPENVVWAIRYHHQYSIFSGERERATPAVQTLVALGVLCEHLVARFLGYPDDAEWAHAGDKALRFIGLQSDSVGELLEAMLGELQEIRAYRP